MQKKTDNNFGYELLIHTSTNKSTAFTKKEREQFGLAGLLPAKISSIDDQKTRVLANIRRKNSDIEKYIAMQALQNRNERLYFRTLIDNIDELMPIVYTPTVGQACKEFAHIFRQTRGFYVNPSDKGNVRKNLDNWPDPDVKAVVITDGERILGLGDLGSNGMGIPVGKLALYTACAGVRPDNCLPIMLDVGTNNTRFIDDPLYLGTPKPRIQGQEYDELIDELLNAIQDKWPGTLIQFEDFLTPNAFKILNKYRDKFLCFNDDIQGTAAVALSGIYSSTKISKINFKDLRVMFLGAGSAATGIGDLLIKALKEEGLSDQEAKNRLSFVDLDGLLVKSRNNLLSHNKPYLLDLPQMSFIEAIKEIKPHILIGATGAANSFTQEVIETMAEINEKPAIFALSNPTSKAECTAEQAYNWSRGRAIFASGSPFKKVTIDNQTFSSSQSNNAYIFPGIALGAISCQSKLLTEKMFLVAAKTLADEVSQEMLKRGAVYPPLKSIREVSLNIAIAVAEQAYAEDLATLSKPENLRNFISNSMYDPNY